MSGLFKDPSLEVTIDVVVTRTVIFETDRVRKFEKNKNKNQIMKGLNKEPTSH